MALFELSEIVFAVSEITSDILPTVSDTFKDVSSTFLVMPFTVSETEPTVETTFSISGLTSFTRFVASFESEFTFSEMFFALSTIVGTVFIVWSLSHWFF